MTLFDTSGHLTLQCLRALQSGKLAGAEVLAAYEHIAACDDCAEQFAVSFPSDALLRVPTEFETHTLNKLQEQQRVVELPKKNGKLSFTAYTLRVGLAVAASLVMVFSGLFSPRQMGHTAVQPGERSSLQQLADYSDSIAAKTRALSNQILNFDWEVFRNAKEEK